MAKKPSFKEVAEFLEEKFPHGSLTAKEVLDLARPKSSPIHSHFDWNDSEAAESWRLHQARMLIACVVVEIDGESVRKYQTPVLLAGQKEKRYLEIEQAINNKDIWDQILVRALHEAEAYKLKYQKLKKLAPVIGAIDKVLLRANKKERSR